MPFHTPTARARGGVELGRVRGIRIRVDPSWLFIFVLVFWSLSSGYFPRAHPDEATSRYWVAGLVCSLLFFGSILAHELAHALEARRRGMEVPSITLFLFGGVSEMTREPQSPRDEIGIAAAGPLASFAVAALFWLAARALQGNAPPLWVGGAEYLSWTNVALGVFNLLPGLPLDGGRILRAVVWARRGSLRSASRVASSTGQMLGIGLAILGALQIFSGALVGGIWLVLIGIFLRGLAEATYRSLLLRQSIENVSVEDAMTRDVVTVPPDLRIQELIDDFLVARGHRGFPVVDGDRVLGTIALDGIRDLPAHERDRTTVADRMEALSATQRISPEAPLESAIARMGETGVRRLLVMRGDELIGLLTEAGIARFLDVRRALAGDEDAAERRAGAAAALARP